MLNVSPKYLMSLISSIEVAVWQTYSSYKNVTFYIKKWHNEEWDYIGYSENFKIYNKNDGNIDLAQTLHGMSEELLFKVAIDLGVETPGFIPGIAIFKNEFIEDNKNIYECFQKALKNVEENPDLAIGLANSTLESIIKEILNDAVVSSDINKKDTLYKLTEEILKKFLLYPGVDQLKEINDIGSKLLNLSQNIEALRSEKTSMHGKTKEDYLIDDPLYAYFIINVITTIGLFLSSYYKKKFHSENNHNSENLEKINS